jgi:hypothetical protein
MKTLRKTYALLPIIWASPSLDPGTDVGTTGCSGSFLRPSPWSRSSR